MMHDGGNTRFYYSLIVGDMSLIGTVIVNLIVRIEVRLI